MKLKEIFTTYWPVILGILFVLMTWFRFEGNLATSIDRQIRAEERIVKVETRQDATDATYSEIKADLAAINATLEYIKVEIGKIR